MRAMLENLGIANLGLTGFGPDVPIFPANLLNTGIYQQIAEERYSFVGSDHVNDQNVKHVLRAIEEFFLDATETPRSFRELIDILLSPPYGIRADIIPILFAAAYLGFPRPLNLMDEGVYVKDLKAETFERILQVPDKITVQCVPLPLFKSYMPFVLLENERPMTAME